MTFRSAFSAAAVARAVLCAVAVASLPVALGRAGPAAAQRTAAPAVPEFQSRLDQYLELRGSVEARLAPMTTVASAAELAERQQALATEVRRLRLEEPPPRLVPDAVASHVRTVVAAFFAKYPDDPAADQPIDLLPEGHPPVVNGRYFSYVPVSTIPPQLLAQLPRLPDNLQYRFHGDYLIVLDADLMLVLDVIPDALPPYGPAPVRAPAARALLDETGGAAGADTVRLAVIGDSGTGGRAQHEIAEQMVRAHSRFPFVVVLMLGDNLYGDEDDDDYVDKFADPYAPLLAAGIQFYAVLGNHDEATQIYYEPFNMDGRRYYTLRRGPVDFFMLDSTYMGPGQVAWLTQALAASDAPWKVAAMHHPIYSTGRRHGASEELRDLLEPIFVQHGVDLVLSGHEHFYERLVPQHGIHYLTSGSAAKLRERGVAGGPQTAASFDEGYSFLLMQFEPASLTFEAVSAAGRIVDAGVMQPRSSGAQ